MNIDPTIFYDPQPCKLILVADRIIKVPEKKTAYAICFGVDPEQASRIIHIVDYSIHILDFPELPDCLKEKSITMTLNRQVWLGFQKLKEKELFLATRIAFWPKTKDSQGGPRVIEGSPLSLELKLSDVTSLNTST